MVRISNQKLFTAQFSRLAPQQPYLYDNLTPERYLCKASAETSKHFFHIATFLHGDDTQVILLIHPHKECLLVIVPDKHDKYE